VPVVLHRVTDSGTVTTMRSEQGVLSLFKNTQEIWLQASIAFSVTIDEVNFEAETVERIESGDLAAIYETPECCEEALHIYFLNGIATNGIAVGRNLAVVNDITTVNDFRATAHEIGHLLGLGHTLESRERLMFQGVNGERLSRFEIETARGNALRIF